MATIASSIGQTPEGGMVGVPGGGQLWRNEENGAVYVVYAIPDTDVPMMWHVPDPETLTSLFPPGAPITYDRRFASSAELNAEGPLNFGSVLDIANTTRDPWEAWEEQYEREAEIRPWLKDPEILSLVAAAFIEGRDVTEAELKTTDWWTSHTAEERAWIETVASDPSTARQTLEDNRRTVSDLLREAGVNNAPLELVQELADRWTQGSWSDSFVQRQITALSDPAAAGRVAKPLQKVLGDKNLDTTSAREQEVRDLARSYLGPAFGELNPQQVSNWAGKLRNDPDAADRLTQHLQRQRAVLFPQYGDDPSLTYDDIAQPWRTLWFQTLGEQADETDRNFINVVRMNDVTEAERQVTAYGFNHGNQQVMDQFKQTMSQAFGDDVLSLREAM